MTAFAAAAAALFADPHQAQDVGWQPGGAGPVTTVRGITSAPDETSVYGETTLQAETMILSALVSQVASPAEGDRFTIGGAGYILQGEPRRDALQLVWRMVLVPEALA